MAKSEFEIVIDTEKLAEAMQSLRKDIEEFHKMWNSIPFPIRWTIRFRWFLDDVADTFREYSTKFYDSIKLRKS